MPAFFAMGSQPNQTGQNSAPFLVQMFPFILMLGVFYFVLIRPQQKKAKEHAQLLKTIRTGDKVLTTGGIVGVVVGVKEKSISLRSADAKMEVLKSAVSEITERNSAAGES